MKRKSILRFLIFVLAATSLFFDYRYLQLLQKNNSIKAQEKSILSTYLSSSISNADKIDWTKVSIGDKDSILSLMEMYEGISNSNIALWTTFEGQIEIIDPMYTSQYTRVLKDIFDKSVKGELKPEDINNFKLLNQNIKLIYNYISENDDLSSKDFKAKVLPYLKQIKLTSDVKWAVIWHTNNVRNILILLRKSKIWWIKKEGEHNAYI